MTTTSHTTDPWPDPDPEVLDLARRHETLLRAALAEAGVAPARVSVMALPGISDWGADVPHEPPPTAALTSPWLNMERDAEGGIALTLFVSDLRILADVDLLARKADPAAYDKRGGLRTISPGCLSEAAQRYVDAATSGRVPGAALFEGGCVPDALVPHLLGLFASARQVYFAPFDIAVLERLLAVRGESEAFYSRLYPLLVRHGVDALDAGGASGAGWWHRAIRAISE